jgi:hypothetical protein
MCVQYLPTCQGRLLIFSAYRDIWPRQCSKPLQGLRNHLLVYAQGPNPKPHAHCSQSKAHSSNSQLTPLISNQARRCIPPYSILQTQMEKERAKQRRLQVSAKQPSNGSTNSPRCTSHFHRTPYPKYPPHLKAPHHHLLDRQVRTTTTGQLSKLYKTCLQS